MVITEIKRLQPTTIFIVGGTAVISSATAAKLAPLAKEGVQRVWGADRYATAVAVERSTTGTSAKTFVVSGQGFADGIAAGPTAARLNAAILLTPQDKLAPATETVLRSIDRPDWEGLVAEVFIVGGPGAISLAVEARIKAVVQPGVDVRRVAGTNRYETAKALAGLWTGEWGPAVNAFVASGTTFPDALAATPAASLNEAPMLLSTGTCTASATAAALAALQPRLTVYLGCPTVTYAGTRTC